MEFNYKDYLKLINKMVYGYHRKTGLDINDLKSEANLIYVKATKSFDNTKNCKFSSYLYQQLNGYLAAYCRLEHNQVKTEQAIVTNRKISIDNNWIDFINSVNDEVKEVIETIVNAPAELLSLSNTKKVTKQKVYKYYKNKGWKRSKILNVFKQIETLI